MHSSDVMEYIDLLLSGDEKTKQALFACSAALYLDDEMARDAIKIVTQSNGMTDNLLRRIKSLGCVWTQWDGTWYIAEDIRAYLCEKLSKCVPLPIQLRLRNRLAELADNQSLIYSSDGQITSFRKQRATFEAAYQRVLIPDQTTKGAQQFTDLWQNSPLSVAQATAEAVDYISPEIDRHLKHPPLELLFLRGMAAWARKDKKDQLRYFGEVWKKGRQGYIFAIAAHLFGTIVKNKEVAESALYDSIRWNNDLQHQSQVYHSLGNLLSKDRTRSIDAEVAYKKSLDLDNNPQSQAETYHSLGNFLSKDEKHWIDAEVAYKKSLDLDNNPKSRAETYHSLGNFLSKDRTRWIDAEVAYKKSLDLNKNPQHQVQVYHSLGNFLSKDRTRWIDAEVAYKKSLDLDNDPLSQAKTYHSLGNLLSKDRTRRIDAEAAYKKSLDLETDPKNKAQIYASCANLLSKSNEEVSLTIAEEMALNGIALDPGNPWTNGVCYRVLAEINEKKGETQKAIANYELLLRTNMKLGYWEFVIKIERKIIELRESM